MAETRETFALISASRRYGVGSVPSMRTVEKVPSWPQSISMRLSRSTTAAVSAGSISSRRILHVIARYMAPELTITMPSRSASARASVLFPEAAGPSMAMAW